MLLDKIDSPRDLKELSMEELEQLGSEALLALEQEGLLRRWAL